MKDLISVADLTSEQLNLLVKQALRMKQGRIKGTTLLKSKILALVFEKPSLRTRVSFEVAMEQLGGHAIYLSPAEVGLGTREPVQDVARVLSRFVSGIAARTFAHDTVQQLARFAAIPVINALSDFEHPCQALADVMTIYEKKGHYKDVSVAYVGDGNNVAHSLLLACVLTGMNCRLACPAGYGADRRIVEQAGELATRTGARVSYTTKPREAVSGADVVYTDVWVSMGQEAEKEKRLRDFQAYKVDASLLSVAKSDVILMHPMPVHYGDELTREIADSPASVLIDQAENRLHIQKAILAHLLKAKPS